MYGQWEIVGKTFVITGGASGLGARYAETFLKEGAKNVVILDISEDLGVSTAEKLNKTYPNKVTFIKCDFGCQSDIDAAFRELVDKLGRVDVIINNAGLMNDSPGVWWKSCEVNYQGLVSTTLKGVEHMTKENGGAGGTIINIASTVALCKLRHLPIYSGLKTAVLQFSLSLSTGPFFEETGVRILALCLGPTDTPLLHKLDDRTYNKKIGEELVRISMLSEELAKIQKVESVIIAVLQMYKTGANGSAWLATRNKQIEDITPLINKHYEDFHKLDL